MEAMRDFRPVNLPTKFETVPMPVPPVHAGAEEAEATAGEGSA